MFQVRSLPQEFYNEHCVLCDQVTIRWFDGNTMEFSELVSQPIKRGIMCTNKSMVAFINEEGHYYVTPLRSQTMKILREAGYREENIYVPFSSGEHIANNKELNDKLNRLIKVSRDEIKALVRTPQI